MEGTSAHVRSLNNQNNVFSTSEDVFFGIQSQRIVAHIDGALSFWSGVILIDRGTGKIFDLVRLDQVPSGVKVYDVGSAAVLPGMIDLNVSLSWDLGVEVGNFSFLLRANTALPPEFRVCSPAQKKLLLVESPALWMHPYRRLGCNIVYFLQKACV